MRTENQRDVKNQNGNQNGKNQRIGKNHRDTKEGRDFKEHREPRDSKDQKDVKDHRESREGIELRDNKSVREQKKGEKNQAGGEQPRIKIIPLGGLEQIGMNITAFEYEDNIIVVDCGLSFPTDDMLGIDLVIPDVTYLEQNLSKVKGFVITHGHEDHIGADRKSVV